MGGRRKTWKEKFARHAHPRVEVLDKPFGGAQAGARMLIATPRVIADYMHSIPAGEVRSVKRMRADLAHAYGADIACPLTTSLFARIVAETAWEDAMEGGFASVITPFWRVIHSAEPLAQKLTCGAGFLKERQEAERQTVR